MNAAAYYRVSSKSQDLAMQRLAVERAAAARGDTISSEYSEKMSARTIARPELDRLRSDARAGIVRRLYVYRLDRLARSGIRDTFEVVDELRHHGVDLVSISDGFSLDGPAAEVVLAVMAWAAKMERLAINERIASARERVEAEGRKWGRPSRVTPELLARIKVLRKEGRTLREIAVAMKIPRSTIGEALSEKVGARSAPASPRS